MVFIHQFCFCCRLIPGLASCMPSTGGTTRCSQRVKQRWFFCTKDRKQKLFHVVPGLTAETGSSKTGMFLFADSPKEVFFFIFLIGTTKKKLRKHKEFIRIQNAFKIRFEFSHFWFLRRPNCCPSGQEDQLTLVKLGDRLQKSCKWRGDAASEDALYASWICWMFVFFGFSI